MLLKDGTSLIKEKLANQSLADPVSLECALERCPPLAVLDGMGGENCRTDGGAGGALGREKR